MLVGLHARHLCLMGVSDVQECCGSLGLYFVHTFPTPRATHQSAQQLAHAPPRHKIQGMLVWDPNGGLVSVGWTQGVKEGAGAAHGGISGAWCTQGASCTPRLTTPGARPPRTCAPGLKLQSTYRTRVQLLGCRDWRVRMLGAYFCNSATDWPTHCRSEPSRAAGCPPTAY
jgi:hypothetical protein